MAAMLAPLLSGCNAIVLSPHGDVASQQADLVIISTFLMLLIIVPVMVLTVIFARKYRASNEEADYQPEWEHSTQLELIIWAAPLLIIIALGAVTWTGTHKLDPYRPIERIAANKPLPAGVKPLDVEVVAMDWKWLFVIPEYGIATVNDLAAPIDRPIRFHITSSSVMNSFYIPALAGQIYAMPSMETQLNAVINKPGTYEGFSANYSGEGFNHMRFAFHGMTEAGFQQWVAEARQSGLKLDRASYLKLAQPTIDAPVMRYGSILPQIYQLALNNCVVPGTPCIADQMRRDQETAAGQTPDSAHMGEMAMSPHSTMPVGASQDEEAEKLAQTPLRGAGLTPPSMLPPRPVLAETRSPASTTDSL
ncbi:ubiquinol oxidase subunit II [Porphyrobacter algicida]|uniref:Ubiquinol oxidase subunit 2 n=1 Tax=Qipengyuania algicida TaxID=1836209 RepID=A0A845ADT6_9SPHN|nr:ubiquinol oxidase subunit II [Qipengyuania algicida]MXP28642.1 ubiquinol oxidase subunit II [Qipengyuania algicida]